jgi:hypothetical protein
MAGGERRLVIAGIDPLTADLLADAAARGEGASRFLVAGRGERLSDLPALVDALAPEVLIVGSPDPTAGLPDMCARFLEERADARVVVVVMPELGLAVLYPGAIQLRRPAPDEILAALGCT